VEVVRRGERERGINRLIKSDNINPPFISIINRDRSSRFPTLYINSAKYFSFPLSTFV
jgi:hypothetical protein